MTDVAKEEDAIDLPPGFRFHPTDEEIITYYLSPKLLSHGFSARAIGEVDLNKCEPWDLPSKAKLEGKEMYFFCHRDRKYPTGMRTNRATESGYWKATGKDKEIFQGKGGALVGMKKTLVFYKGRAPKGHKTNWVMHEFRLDGKLLLPDLPKSAKDEWVVCRVFHKNSGAKNNKSPQPALPPDGELLFEPGGSGYYLPPLMDPPRFEQNPSSFDVSISNEQMYDFSAMMSMENQQQQAMMMLLMNNNNSSSNSSLLYPSMQQIAAPPRAHNSCDDMMMSAYDCKLEQCPSPADAGGLSIDQNTEMSSIDEPWTSYGFGI